MNTCVGLPTIISVYQSILRQIWTGTIIRCQAASISYEEKNIFKKPRVYRNYVLLYEWQLQHQQKQKKEFYKEGYYYAPIHKRISYTSFFGHFRYKIAVYCYKLINLMGSAKFYARTDNASNFWKFFLLYIVRLKV